MIITAKIVTNFFLIPVTWLLVQTAFAQDLKPVKIEKIKLFDTEFSVEIYEVNKNNQQGRNLTFLSLHHDEVTGLDVSKDVISKRGGKLVVLVSKDDNENGLRNIYFKNGEDKYKMDPNRLFGEAGIKAKLSKYLCKYVRNKNTEEKEKECSYKEYDDEDKKEIVKGIKKFSKKLLKTFKRENSNDILVAVHNNTQSIDVKDRYSFLDYLYSGSEHKWARMGMFFANEDIDDFFMVSNQILYDKLTNFDKSKWSFNIVIQEDSPKPDDGSLSVYYGNKKWNYILVEAEDGRGEKRQKEMINTLIDVFETN